MDGVAGTDSKRPAASSPAPNFPAADNMSREYFGEQGMLGYMLNVQRQKIRDGIACVRHQNMAGSDIGDDHKEYFVGEAAPKAGGSHNTMNQFC